MWAYQASYGERPYYVIFHDDEQDLVKRSGDDISSEWPNTNICLMIRNVHL